MFKSAWNSNEKYIKSLQLGTCVLYYVIVKRNKKLNEFNVQWKWKRILNECKKKKLRPLYIVNQVQNFVNE